MITPIQELNTIAGKELPELRSVNSAENMFADVFQSAIDNVRTTDQEKAEAQYLLATGQLDNPAALTIAATKNQIAVDLLVQLRNKALEAYNEVTRINM